MGAFAFYEDDTSKLKVKVKKLVDNAVIPTRGSLGAAGYDLYASYIEGMAIGDNNDFVIRAHDHVTIGTGIAMEIPEGYVGLVYVRSGLGIKQGLIPRNAVGVIDSDYRGEIKVCLLNTSEDDVNIKMGERVAQIVLTPYLEVAMVETNELNDTERGDGGFGSTGK